MDHFTVFKNSCALVQKMTKLYLMSTPFNEVVESGKFKYVLYTSSMLSIPKTGGCRCLECNKADTRTFSKQISDKVVIHNNGDYSCKYDKMWVRFSNN